MTAGTVAGSQSNVEVAAFGVPHEDLPSLRCQGKGGTPRILAVPDPYIRAVQPLHFYTVAIHGT